jgi:putative transposase
MCRLLKVTRQGFYSWRRRPTCRRKLQDAYLRELIQSIHQRSRCNYGWPRIWDELRFDHGVRCGGKRVFRLMRQLRIHGTHRRRYRKTTQRAPEAALAPDLMNRNFTASRPDEKYVADITYIRTWEGWLYLGVVLDVFSRYVVGWAMATTLHTQLVVDALNMAIHQRRPPKGTIAHSDQGSQFSSLSYGRRLREAGLVASMGSRGDAYDNAMAEAFFATLECELLAQHRFQTRDQARMAVFDFIEGWYNTQRRHSSLGMLSPAKFERRWHASNQLEEVKS